MCTYELCSFHSLSTNSWETERGKMNGKNAINLRMNWKCFACMQLRQLFLFKTISCVANNRELMNCVHLLIISHSVLAQWCCVLLFAYILRLLNLNFLKSIKQITFCSYVICHKVVTIMPLGGSCHRCSGACWSWCWWWWWCSHNWLSYDATQYKLQTH